MTEPLSPRRRPLPPALVLAVVCLAGGLLPASLTGASVALPGIGAALHAGLVSQQWVVNAYNLTFASCMLVTGTLADRTGRRAMFTGGTTLFAVCAAASAAAPGIVALDAARALAGAGAAAMLTGGSAILAASCQGPKLTRAFGILGASFGAGLALGPSLSGVLDGALGWRSVFALHLAVCLVILAAAPRLPESRDPQAAKIDWIGSVTFTTALLALTLAVVQASQWGWAAPGTLGLLAVFAAGIAAFGYAETRQVRPMFDLALLRSPRFIAVSAMPVALAFGFVSLLVFLPSYFIGALRMSSGTSGLVLLILTVPVLAIPAASGALARRVPLSLLLGGSLALVGAGAAWLTVLSPGVTIAALAGPLLVIGTGTGVAFGLLDGAAISAAPPERAGMAAGMFNTARLASEAIVIAAMGSVLVTLTDRGLAGHLGALAPGAGQTTVASQVVQGAPIRGLSAVSAAADPARAQHVLAAAYTSGLHHVLWMLAVVCWAGAPVIAALLRSRDGRAASQAGGDTRPASRGLDAARG